MLNKKLIIIILTAVLVVGATIFVFVTSRRPNQLPVASDNHGNNAPSITTTTMVTSSEPSVLRTADGEEIRLSPEWQKIYDVDKDFDGLSDEEEVKLGTSSTTPDTDSDGLLDRDEIQVYNTNPTNSDTDGDGHKDGVEVRRGYNPRGKGKL